MATIHTRQLQQYTQDNYNNTHKTTTTIRTMCCWLNFIIVSKSEDDMGETPGTCGGEVKCWKSFGGET